MTVNCPGCLEHDCESVMRGLSVNHPPHAYAKSVTVDIFFFSRFNACFCIPSQTVNTRLPPQRCCPGSPRPSSWEHLAASTRGHYLHHLAWAAKHHLHSPFRADHLPRLRRRRSVEPAQSSSPFQQEESSVRSGPIRKASCRATKVSQAALETLPFFFMLTYPTLIEW